MRKNHSAAAVIASLALVIGSSLGAAPAFAGESWSTSITCKPGNKCTIASNTTGTHVVFEIDGYIKASWSTGGPRSWTGSVAVGLRNVRIGTVGTFVSHSASCFCPAGITCGIA